MLKKLVCFVVSSIMLMSLSVAVMAAPNADNEVNLTDSEVLQRLMEIEERYDFLSFESIEESGKTSRSHRDYPTLKFDTIEAVESFFASFETSLEPKALPTIYINPGDLFSRNFNGVSTGTTWVPFVNVGTGLFCWFHTDVLYSYNFDSNGNPFFVSANGATSYITGISLSSWTQTSHAQNILNNTIHTQVNGYWFVGIEVFGLTLGSRVTDSYSWNTQFI